MADVKGFILAAGLGTRLQPLTHHLPKPLIPFLGVPIFDLALSRLDLTNVSAIGANTHHLADLMSKHATSQKVSKHKIFVSHEPTLLGTGGFVQPIKSWIGDSHLLIFNGDIVCDIDLGDLINQHIEMNSIATMALTSHHPKTTMIGCEGQTIVSIGSKEPPRQPYTFTGVHILSPEFIKILPAHYTFYNVMDTYKTLLPAGRVKGFFHAGVWHDLGTPVDYYRASMRHLEEFTKIDERFGIQAIWKKNGTGLQHRCEGADHAIFPSGMNSSTVGSNVLAFTEFAFSGKGKLQDSIIFSCANSAVTVTNPGGITMDEHFIAVDPV
jgi:NDP-sugar pyrophosphorylase family protein